MDNTLELTMPRDEELEKIVLGEILVAGSNAFAEIEGELTTKSFYSDAHATIFEAIAKLSYERKAINISELAMILNRENKLEYVGGSPFLSHLITSVSSTVYLANHVKALHDIEVKRKVYILAEKMIALAADKSVEQDEVLEMADKGITELQTNSAGQVFDIDESLGRYYDWAVANAEHKNKVIPTGLMGLDSILDGGFRAPDLVVMGGRPSMGKTAFATAFAEYFVFQGYHTLFFSLEMTDIQLIGRMVAKNGVNSSHVRKGCMTQEEWNIQDENMSRLMGLRLHIACSEDYKQLSAIKAEAHRFKRKGECDVIIIDYLQYIRTKLKNVQRYVEVGYITSELKSLAKELNVPILLLAQVGRNAEGTDVEPPQMSDLRESGNIEQDADIILFPHRPWVYNNEAVDKTGRSWKDRGFIYVAKNREGMRNVKTYFMNDPQFKEFYDDEQANEQLSHE